LSGTFGLCPQKSKPRRERQIVAFQTRSGIESDFGSVRQQSVTQDAEGNLRVYSDPSWHTWQTIYYPRALWRLADERNAKPL
jgi:hypothetical protein